MNIYSWNVNGLRSALKKGFSDWFAATKPDILCLQEVRAEVDQIPDEVAKPEGYFAYWNPCQKYIFLLHKCVKTFRIHRETENRLKFNSNGKKEKENLQTLFKFYHNSKEKICQTEEQN